jgi:aminoglycoside phosphotransferase (APT) family kinase protein
MVASGKQPSLADAQVVARIMQGHGVERPRLLGEGGEGLVFDYKADSVIKIYKRTTLAYLQRLQWLHGMLETAALPFGTPLIEAIHQIGPVYYTVERKLHGRQLDDRLPPLSERDSLRALAAYVEGLPALHAVEASTEPYGQLLPAPDAIRAATWPAFLLAKLEQRARVSWSWLERDVPRLGDKVRALERRIANLPATPPKSLVHGDYSQYNVLLNERLEVASVLDFSYSTVVGDSLLDVACTVVFPEINPGVGPVQRQFLLDHAKRAFGPEVVDIIHLYRVLYGFYNADNYGHNATIYGKCVEAITESDAAGGLSPAEQERPRSGASDALVFAVGTSVFDHRHADLPESRCVGDGAPAARRRARAAAPGANVGDPRLMMQPTDRRP